VSAVSNARVAVPPVDLDLLPTALVVTRIDGTIEAANELAAAVLGADGGSVVGQPLGAFVGAGLGDALHELAQASDGAAIERETALRGSGSAGRLLLVGRRDERGGEPFVFWSLQQLESTGTVERRLRQLAEELDAERQRLAVILEGMPAGVIVAGAPTGRILITNGQAEVMLRQRIKADGIAEYDQIVGFDEAGRRLEPQDWPLARALIRGDSISGERVRVERDDGSSFTIEANANPIRDTQGEIVAAVVVFWDVSERERRERAEREFITNAAHELQTPVASIVSAVEVLVGGAKDVPEDRERFLGHLERESGRLVRILRSLLVIARTQLAGETVDLAPVRLRPLLDGIALGLRPRQGIEVVVRCPARLTALSNEELLEQAVGNLAANSARHTASGRITLSASRRPEGLCVEVADTGPGIDPAEVERMFQRFTRAEPRDADGFGLGLPIVRATVTAVGGTVSLTPRRGGGTLARIVLPETGTEEP
jgi:two-component system, OmpR family, phosphate regulon sensor histidine kinase PhoR